MFEDNIHNNKLHILGKLTASLIHEIRNPLSVVRLNLDYMKMLKEELPQEANETVESSIEALERLQQLVDTVSDFSKRNPYFEALCSLNDISLKTADIVKSSANYNNVQLSLDLQNDIPNIYFDKVKLLQITLNLVTNSIEACRNEGNVVIRTFIDNRNRLVWQVEDNGVGIPEEIKEQIFNDFFTNKKKGTGLGLSVCKRLLEEYHSDINFESEPGKGTKFFVLFNPKLLQEYHEEKNTNN